ncbi:alpha/beta fold hydrolase [Ornithinimicrobium humiphilum]|uniref:Pimeloyl-ACP methyl ester carboxylesterase n=1 Tax=Ornithinimicrobium humiphilum TaxID=125288 RepID=A0A543KNZ7_9MICO|nr:alpha/beta fold hydrolase [Ornithinimicrobium humiphilum]TQM96783.1 pimeloyl-ACP methyl ester carboxylesterase [Ornithinimicrobium humiphilum]
MSEGLHSTLVGEGDGPVVVFLHGLFGRGRNFATAARAVQPELRALLVDLPDHGASPWTDRVDYGAMADAVAEHLRSGVAADGPVHVVGHSMGGKTAMTLALAHPDLVDRLVVEDVGPTGTGETSEFEHLLGALSRIDLEGMTSTREADEQLAAEVPQRTLRGFLLQNLRRDDHGRLAWQPNLEVLRRDLPAITGDIPQLGSDAVFEGPVLWVAGADSDYVTAEAEPVMRQHFPQTRRVTIKDAGHWVHSQQPEVFAEVLRRFLIPA